jgi:hypothetical protein
MRQVLQLSLLLQVQKLQLVAAMKNHRQMQQPLPLKLPSIPHSWLALAHELSQLLSPCHWQQVYRVNPRAHPHLLPD